MKTPVSQPSPEWVVKRLENGQYQVKQLLSEHGGIRNYDIVCTIYGSEQDVLKRARIIAAAPDLFDSLNDIICYSGGADNATEDEYIMERANIACNYAVLGKDR